MPRKRDWAGTPNKVATAFSSLSPTTDTSAITAGLMVAVVSRLWWLLEFLLLLSTNCTLPRSRTAARTRTTSINGMPSTPAEKIEPISTNGFERVWNRPRGTGLRGSTYLDTPSKTETWPNRQLHPVSRRRTSDNSNYVNCILPSWVSLKSLNMFKYTAVRIGCCW